jgi:hypothetical protein
VALRSTTVPARRTSKVASGALVVKLAVLPATAVSGPESVSVPVNGALTSTVWVVVAPLTVSLTV